MQQYQQQTFNDWIDELLAYELTDFIHNLIQDGNINREHIYYGYNDYINTENRNIIEWHLINDFFEEDDLNLQEHDITHIIFGGKIFVGLITERNTLHRDTYWKQLYKSFYD